MTAESPPHGDGSRLPGNGGPPVAAVDRPRLVRVAARTDKGRSRSRNEDAIGVDGWVLQRPRGEVTEFSVEVGAGVAIVLADGLGGHPAGDVASRIAAAVLGEGKRPLTSDGIERRFRGAHDAIRASASADPDRATMASTAVLLTIDAASVFVANVGDSRAYELTDSEAIQISQDDSPGAIGSRSPETRTSIVTQVLGDPRSAPTAHVERFATEHGLRFLLCSDGLTDVVSIARIAELASRLLRGSELVDALVEAALAAGAPDNISVVVVETALEEVTA